jgi:hypothetical protein
MKRDLSIYYFLGRFLIYFEAIMRVVLISISSRRRRARDGGRAGGHAAIIMRNAGHGFQSPGKTHPEPGRRFPRFGKK